MNEPRQKGDAVGRWRDAGKRRSDVSRARQGDGGREPRQKANAVKGWRCEPRQKAGA